LFLLLHDSLPKEGRCLSVCHSEAKRAEPVVVFAFASEVGAGFSPHITSCQEIGL